MCYIFEKYPMEVPGAAIGWNLCGVSFFIILLEIGSFKVLNECCKTIALETVVNGFSFVHDFERWVKVECSIPKVRIQSSLE